MKYVRSRRNDKEILQTNKKLEKSVAQDQY